MRDNMNRAAEEHGMGGGNDFFSFKKSGEYVLRVLTEPLAMATHFFGKGVPGSVCYGKDKGCPFESARYDSPTVKFQCYLIDRSDGKVKIGELPWSVISVLADLEEDNDWSFVGYPMPYDIKVKVDKENADPKQIYKTLGVPRREALTTEEENEFSRKASVQTVEQYIALRKEKQIEKHKEAGIWLSEEKRAEIEAARIAEGKAVAAAHAHEKSSEVAYPDKEYNPEDITFDAPEEEGA